MDQKRSQALEEVFSELMAYADHLDKKAITERRQKKQQPEKPPEAEKKEG